MAYSFTEKKRIRRDFGKRPAVIDEPYLLAIQTDSYKRFLDMEGEQENTGLQRAFESIFPIVSFSGNVELEYVSYRIKEPVFDVMRHRCACSCVWSFMIKRPQPGTVRSRI